MFVYRRNRKILLGIDYPFRPIGPIVDALGRLGLSESQLKAVDSGNALTLLLRLARRLLIGTACMEKVRSQQAATSVQVKYR